MRYIYLSSHGLEEKYKELGSLVQHMNLTHHNESWRGIYDCLTDTIYLLDSFKESVEQARMAS